MTCAQSPALPLPTAPSRPDEAMPSIQLAIDTVAAHVLADTLDQFLHVEHRAKVIGDRARPIGNLDRWWNLAIDATESAGRFVARAILGWHHPRSLECRESDQLTVRWPNAAVAYRGKLFIAAAGADFKHLDEGGDDNGAQVMFLTVVDLLPGQKVEPDLTALVDLDAFFSRRPAPIPPARSPQEAEAADRAFRAKDGFGEALDARDAAEERNRRPPAWAVTTQDVLICHEPNRLTLDEVIAQETAGNRSGDDIAIWQGERIAAVIQAIDGSPVVTRFRPRVVPSPAPMGARPRAKGKPKGRVRTKAPCGR